MPLLICFVYFNMNKHTQIYKLFIISIGILFSDTHDDSCIAPIDNREIYRNEFTYPETIQSEHFIIHFTTSDADSQFVNGQWFNLQCNAGYAQSILDHAESALTIYLQDGWESLPPDCDESISNLDSPDHCINFGGNSLYDIYLSNDGVGMVVPETLYPVAPYTGGYTSYMKISTLLNEHETLPSWSHHVVAHELHHSIQLRYGYSVSGVPGDYMYNGWLFEQTATYMENVIYPNSIHLSTMLGNCNVVTPLTYPEYNIDYPAEIYPYRSALWQKFLVESLGDSSIIRYIWEDYGLEYATGNTVSLFPIYNNAVESVTGNEDILSDAYANYAIWRYFTGDRSVSNEYFDESLSYCTASTVSDFENSFVLSANKGASQFINLPSEDMNLIIFTDSPDDMHLSHLKIDPNDDIHLVSLNHQNNNFYFSISSEDTNVLIANSNYNDIETMDIIFSLSVNYITGDLNNDGAVNILDIVILVEHILSPATVELEGADINYDGDVDILDIVQLVNIVLN